MRFGFVLPATTDGEALCAFAEAADDLGVESIWTGDHIVMPSDGTDQYPYTKDGSFTAPADRPIMETMTVLSYVAARTRRVRIGSTVVILAHRNPLVQAKMFATLDVLTGGRVICGVGVGWLEKEFDVLGMPYAERGALSDEYLEIFKCLWTEDYPEHHGRFFSFDGIRFYPKPVQEPHIPIWVGGHSRAAVRRTAKYGDAWHPTRQSPEYVAGLLPYLRSRAEECGRAPESIEVSLKRSVHFTDLGMREPARGLTGGAVVAATEEVVADVIHCAGLGIDQLTYDFRTADVGDCIRSMEHFMREVAPAADGR